MSGHHKPSVGSRTERFLKTCGAFFPSSVNSFWHRMESSLGSEYAERLYSALEDRSNGKSGPEAVYDLQYLTPQAALLTASLVSPFLEPWLTFFETAELPEGDVLELGSGNGLASMFYATLRPEATVLGVDTSPAAVASATKIAATLNISNVRFEVAAISDEWQPGRTYPVVVSCTVLREIEPPSSRSVSFSTLQGIARGLESKSGILARAASRALGTGGAYLSLERNPSEEDLAAWIGSQQAAELGVDLQGSSAIRASSVLLGEPERLWGLVARAGAAPVDLEQLVSWLVEDRLAAPELSAELELKRHPPISLLGGWHIEVVDDYGPGQTKLGVFYDSGKRYLLYYATSRGSRKLFSARSGDPTALFEQANSLFEQVQSDPNVREIRDLDPAEVSAF